MSYACSRNLDDVAAFPHARSRAGRSKSQRRSWNELKQVFIENGSVGMVSFTRRHHHLSLKCCFLSAVLAEEANVKGVETLHTLTSTLHMTKWLALLHDCQQLLHESTENGMFLVLEGACLLCVSCSHPTLHHIQPSAGRWTFSGSVCQASGHSVFRKQVPEDLCACSLPGCEGVGQAVMQRSDKVDGCTSLLVKRRISPCGNTAPWAECT